MEEEEGRSGVGSRSQGGTSWFRRLRRPVASSILPLTFWLMFLLYSSAREGVRELLPLLLGTGEGPLLLVLLLVLLPPPPVLLSLMLKKGELPLTPLPLVGGRGGREGG